MNTNFIETLRSRKSDFPTPEEALDKAHACDIISKDIYTDNTRFVYELLQNADDASCKSGKLTFRIDFVGYYLVVSHCGKAFTEDDIESICSIGDGTKISDSEQTGFKGIGFKSVFAHSKSVIIKSGDYCFKFDQEESVIWNSKWGDRSAWEQLRAQKGKDVRVKMPWQVIPINTELPSNVKHLLDGMSEFTVSTILKCRAVEDMKNSIAELFSTSQLILFLRSKEVSITINGSLPLTIIKSESDGVTTISKNGDVVSQWLMYTTRPFDVPQSLREKMSEDSDHYPEKLREAKKASMSFAIAVKDGKIVKIDSDLNNIFAFLPTSVDSYKLPFIVNANFITDAGRQNLHKDYVWNQWLFEEMPKHFMSFIKDIADGGNYGLDFLKVVIKTTGSSDALGEKFAKGMSEALKQTAFLPIGDRLLKTSEAIFDETNIFSCLSSDMLIDYLSTNGTQYVSNNILPQSYRSFVGVLRKLSVYVFDAERLLDFLKSETFKSSHKVSENADLITFLSRRYPEPKTDKEKEVDYSWLRELPFVFSETMQLCCPNTLCLPSAQFVSELEGSFDTIFAEVFNALSYESVNWLKWLGMSEPTDTSIIDTGKLFESGYINYNNSVDVVRYIFKLHKQHKLSDDQYDLLRRLPLLTTKDNILPAESTYLSNDYQPSLELEFDYVKDWYVSPCYLTSLQDLSEWKYFFEKIGVAESANIESPKLWMFAERSNSNIQFRKDYITKVMEELATENRGEWAWERAYTYFTSIRILDECIDNFDLSKRVWKSLLENKHLAVDDLFKDFTIWKFYGWNKQSYTSWLVENAPLIPTTLYTCEKSVNVYSNSIPYILDIAADVLPVLDYSEPISSVWQDHLHLITDLSLEDYLKILSNFCNRNSYDKQEIKRKSLRIYKILSEKLVTFNEEQKELIKKWASENQIIARDGYFYNPSELSVVLVEGFAGSKFAYTGSESLSDDFIALLKLMDVKVIDHVSPSFTGEPVRNVELSNRLSAISPLIACINGENNDWSISNVLNKLAIYSVDGILLSYGNQDDLINKSVYFSQQDFAIYIKGDWKSPRVLDGLEQPLGRILHLSRDNFHMLGILLSEDIVDCIEYLKEYGINVPVNIVEILKSSALVDSCKMQSENGDFVEVSLEDTIYGGLSKKDMGDYLKSAKDLVRLELESQHYDFSEAYGLDASTYGNVYGVKDPQGIVCPLVVHSYRNSNRDFTLTAMDWEQLAKRNSMLWIVTNEGAKCVPFYKLMENRGRISMSFNVDNCEYQERMIALAEIMRYFKGLKFDFGSLRDSFTNIAVRFNQPEKALAEKLGADDLEMLF